MNNTVVIDISTFIWSQEDFEQDPKKYFQLIQLVPTLYRQITNYKLPILFRKELFDVIQGEFPYSISNNISKDFAKITMSFISKSISRWVKFESLPQLTIKTEPELLKKYFSQTVKVEFLGQVGHLYTSSSKYPYNYIIYNDFFKSKRNLLIKKNGKTKEIETLLYSSEGEILIFFDRFKLKFKHNPKHDKYKAGGIISPLSCYNERIPDIGYVEKLLNGAYLFDEDYYNFDLINNVYVVFVSSNDNTFHGFDLSDDGKIPHKVKETFKKDGKRF
jgi:hypothetical protein